MSALQWKQVTSGSGKSTLLYILNGLDKADSGSIILDGKEVSNLSDADESAMRCDNITRALINRPQVIFADEPIGNLDSYNGKEVLELLGKLNQQYGITILMVTHSDDSIRYSNRVIQLKDGQIV